ncbi:beta strand repeat-containing protein [Mycolicibacterium aubagnense]|uniref:beta strand repeat-containing protein n=1 Tax=Mycolicibacterium aubagnense TaxID=319707 RepID=UPI0010FD5D1A|nr:hypothetical protein [Mycolicibacterium aubagnense]
MLRTSVAAAAAAAVVVAPLPLAEQHHLLPTPHIATPTVRLTGISQSDIAALVNNLGGAMQLASSTVNGIATTADNTLGGALAATAAVNATVWSGLVAAAGGSRTPLGALLSALATSANSGMAQLNTTIGQIRSTAIVTSGDLTNLLTSVVTGSVSTALNAIANVVNNPLNMAAYIGLIDAPIGIAGLALQKAVQGVGAVTVGSVQIVGNLVTGVDNLIKNAVTTANTVIGTAASATGSDLVAGVITAVQSIVSAPIVASLDGISGLTSTAVTALDTTVTAAANGASSVIGTWLGSGTSTGAIAAALNTIASGPLTPQNYATALAVLAGAGFTTTATITNTARSLLSMPVTAAASLTTTAAAVFGDLANGLAGAGSGMMRAAGLPSLVYNLPYAAAGTIITAVNVAAGTTATVLHSLASAIDFANAVTGAAAVRPAAAATLPGPNVQSAAATETANEAGTASATREAKTSTTPKTADKSSTEGPPAGTATSVHVAEPANSTDAASTPKPETATSTPSTGTAEHTASVAGETAKTETGSSAVTAKSPSKTETGSSTSNTRSAGKAETGTISTTNTVGKSGTESGASTTRATGKAASNGNQHSTDSQSSTGGQHRAADGPKPSEHGSSASAHSGNSSH